MLCWCKKTKQTFQTHQALLSFYFLPPSFLVLLVWCQSTAKTNLISSKLTRTATNTPLIPKSLINQSVKSAVIWAACPEFSILLYLVLFPSIHLSHSSHTETHTDTGAHTRAHTHTHTHRLCISNYSQTQGDWHNWHRMDHSLVQLLFQTSRCSILWHWTTAPTPPSPSLLLTHPAPPSSFPSSCWALPEDDFTLWKRAVAAAAKTMVAALR